MAAVWLWGAHRVLLNSLHSLTPKPKRASWQPSLKARCRDELILRAVASGEWQVASKQCGHPPTLTGSKGISSSLSRNSWGCRTKRSQNWCCQTRPDECRSWFREGNPFDVLDHARNGEGISRPDQRVPVIRHQHVPQKQKLEFLARLSDRLGQQIVFRLPKGGDGPSQIDRNKKDSVRSSQSMDMRHASILTPLCPQKPTTQRPCRGLYLGQ
jgi:hypothetical protein